MVLKPLYWSTANGWGSSPSTVQLLKDFAGNALTATTHTGSTHDFDGDLIELGFFASSLGTDGNPGGGDDTPSTNLFEGTWIPLTTKTYIGQWWGTRNTPDTGNLYQEKELMMENLHFRQVYRRWIRMERFCHS